MHLLVPQIWLITGLCLIFLEALTPGFVIFFFGLGALTVSLLLWIFPGIGNMWAMGIFIVLSVVYLFTLRRLAKNIFFGEKETSQEPKAETVGQHTVVTEAINPPMEGRVEVFGTSWKAIADTPLPKGTEVEVTGQTNLTLTVKAVSK
jgi:membrane protein implicated in regulation of membrane protease activity